jgi:hypothetical protein
MASIKYMLVIRYGLVQEYTVEMEYASNEERQMAWDGWKLQSNVTVQDKIFTWNNKEVVRQVIIPWNSVTFVTMYEEER